MEKSVVRTLEELPFSRREKEELRRAIEKAAEKYGTKVSLFLSEECTTGTKDLRTYTIYIDPFNCRKMQRLSRLLGYRISLEEYCYSLILHEHLHDVLWWRYPEYFRLLDSSIDRLENFFRKVRRKIPFPHARHYMNLFADYFIDTVLSREEILPEDWDVFKKGVLASAYAICRFLLPRLREIFGRYLSEKTPFYAASLYMNFHLFATASSEVVQLASDWSCMDRIEDVLKEEKGILVRFKKTTTTLLFLKAPQLFPEALEDYIKQSIDLAEYLVSSVWGV